MKKVTFFTIVSGIATGRILEDLNIEYLTLEHFLLFSVIILVMYYIYSRCK